MRVALVTEGTYPHFHGGVSTWCDQLVRGLSEHEFDVTAITGTGTEQPAWALPPNVVALRTIPLWGAAVRQLPRRRSLRAGHFKAPLSMPLGVPARTASRTVSTWPNNGFIRDVAQRFGTALVDPDLASARPAFRVALGSWARCAPEYDIEAAVLSPGFIGLLMDRLTSSYYSELWDGSQLGRPTVGDVVTATRLITHAMRPLMAPAPQVDLVHLVANGVAGLQGLAAKWQYGTPYVLSEHGVYLRERYLSFGRTEYSWPLRWLMLRFYRLLTSAVYAEAALVAPGNVYNRRWETWDGVDESAIRTVYNGVDPDAFAVDAREPDVPTISYVGRVDPIKDLATLVRGFGLVRAELPEARLRIFGGTPAGNERYAEQLRMLVHALDLDDAVTFEGRIDVIQDGYAAGHVVALTSISEGFPYTVIEAMSCGRATISTDVGGVAEAVGEAGLVVPPSNPDAFAQACLRLLRDDAERHRLAYAARARVTELFTLERSLNAFRTIYADVEADRAADLLEDRTAMPA
ncbi:MAG: GT4 family glycosyltransferase PelF [Kineosporiaceae bacterium]